MCENERKINAETNKQTTTTSITTTRSISTSESSWSPATFHHLLWTVSTCEKRQAGMVVRSVASEDVASDTHHNTTIIDHECDDGTRFFCDIAIANPPNPHTAILRVAGVPERDTELDAS